MKKEFVIRGQTASGGTDVLEFGGKTKENKNMAYRIVEFVLYPSTNIGGANEELCATISAGKTAITPTDPNFNDDSLIASATLCINNSMFYPTDSLSVVDDTFLITQNLIVMAQETSGAGTPVNWQCRFEAVKMTDSEAAVTNYKQFAIFDE
jgi:hypothetical protein